MNTACVAARPQNRKPSTAARRSLLAFALLAIGTSTFYSAPAMGAEKAQTQTKDTCKLTGSSHTWKVGTKPVVLTADEAPAASGGKFAFYIPDFFSGDPRPVEFYDVPVSAGKSVVKATGLPEDKAPNGKWRTFQFYAVYSPKSGTGCKTNEWAVTVVW